MNIFLATQGDPVWQIGGGIILLAALVLMLALRSPEVHLSPWHHWPVSAILTLSRFLFDRGNKVHKVCFGSLFSSSDNHYLDKHDLVKHVY